MVHVEYSDSECDDSVAEHYELVAHWQVLRVQVEPEMGLKGRFCMNREK